MSYYVKKMTELLRTLSLVDRCVEINLVPRVLSLLGMSM